MSMSFCSFVKNDTECTDVKNYYPILNLTVMSKLLERLVTRQLLNYLSFNKLLPDWQSAVQRSVSARHWRHCLSTFDRFICGKWHHGPWLTYCWNVCEHHLVCCRSYQGGTNRLGLWLISSQSKRTHVNRLVCTCFDVFLADLQHSAISVTFDTGKAPLQFCHV